MTNELDLLVYSRCCVRQSAESVKSEPQSAAKPANEQRSDFGDLEIPPAAELTNWQEVNEVHERTKEVHTRSEHKKRTQEANARNERQHARTCRMLFKMVQNSSTHPALLAVSRFSLLARHI